MPFLDSIQDAVSSVRRIYDQAQGSFSIDPRSTDPETVMARNRLTDESVMSVNPELWFYMELEFFAYDRRTVYNIRNDDIQTQRNQVSTGVRDVGSIGGVAIDALRGAVSGNNTSQTFSAITGELDRADTQLRNSGANNQSQIRQTLARPLSRIHMPLPAQLIESYNIEFENGQFGLIGRSVLDALIRGNGTLEGSLQSALSAAMDQENWDRILTTVRDSLINSIPTLRDVANAYLGSVKNPVNVVVFRGVPLRTHQFSWRIVPESADEQAKVIAVVDALKRHSLPPFENAGEIDTIKFPDFCMVSLHPELYPLPKPCFVQNVTINLSPDGGPSLHNDSKPVAYDISLTLLETTALTREDVFPPQETPPAQ